MQKHDEQQGGSMNGLRCILASVMLTALVACGGGGGSGGTPLTGGGASTGNSNAGTDTGSTTTTASVYPTLSGVLQDATGATTASISASGYTLLVATLIDPSGKPLPSQVVTVAGDATKVVFPEGSGGLTDVSGKATIKVARASLVASGAGLLTLNYQYKADALTTYPDGSKPPTSDQLITRSLGYQLSAANISLSSLDVGSGSLAAYGTRAVSVQANINGTAATSTPVMVSFSASCGTVTPASTSTNSTGLAQVSYSAVNASATNDQGCSGSTVTITASTNGASPVTGTIAIAVAPATNLLFQSATPSTIYLANSGGTTQSIVKFKLVNASNAALQGQNVLLELKDLAGGVPKTTFGTVGNTSVLTLQTDANGEVSVPVFSGTVPTSVVVQATLATNASVTTTSSVLAIASGRAVQSRASLSVRDFAIEGANIDGTTTTLTMALADRQGNPVPDGTAINFVTEGGVMIPASCTTVASRCSVTLRSQNPRPANGLVSVLAYAAGEEDFVDLNFDNIYTAGEPFTDLGNAFRDDSALSSGLSGTWADGDFSVPRAGALACKQYLSGGVPVNSLQDSSFLGRPTSCDGAWGAADVRQQQVIVFATSSADLGLYAWAPSTVVADYQGAPHLNAVTTTFTMTVRDLNGNSMPNGSTIALSAVDKTPTDPLPAGSTTTTGLTCTLDSQSIDVVPNSIAPVKVQGNLKDCVAGDQVQVKVTSPSGLVTVGAVTVP